MKADRGKLSDWYDRNALITGAFLKFSLFLSIFLLLLTSHVAQKEILPLFTGTIPVFSSAILRLLGLTAHASGTQIIGAIPIQMNNACSGAYETALVAAAMLATPSDWMHRVLGIAFASLAIFLLNTIRAACLFTIGLYRPAWFHIAHEYVGQTVMVFAILAIFMAWAFWAIPKNIEQTRVER